MFLDLQDSYAVQLQFHIESRMEMDFLNIVDGAMNASTQTNAKVYVQIRSKCFNHAIGHGQYEWRIHYSCNASKILIVKDRGPKLGEQ